MVVGPTDGSVEEEKCGIHHEVQVDGSLNFVVDAPSCRTAVGAPNRPTPGRDDARASKLTRRGPSGISSPSLSVGKGKLKVVFDR